MTWRGLLWILAPGLAFACGGRVSTGAASDASTTAEEAGESHSGSSEGSSGSACASPSVTGLSTVPMWVCAQAICGAQIAACSADCACNDAVAQGLTCAAAGSSSLAICFAHTLAPVASSSAVVELVTCLQGPAASCAAREAGTTPEAGKSCTMPGDCLGPGHIFCCIDDVCTNTPPVSCADAGDLAIAVSSYDRSCLVDSDCATAADVRACYGPVNCSAEPIAKSALSNEADVAALPAAPCTLPITNCPVPAGLGMPYGLCCRSGLCQTGAACADE